MHFRSCFNSPLALLLALLMAFPAYAFAQGPHLLPQAQERSYKNKAAMNRSNAAGWKMVEGQCTTINDACAQAAIVEVATECGADAQLFTKDVKAWKWIGFALIGASAIFTGIGASATIANAKVYSTLGGTTGLGAFTTTINSNVTTDQGGVTAINTVLANFLTFVQTGGASKGPADDTSIFKSAPIFAAQCAAAANASPASK